MNYMLINVSVQSLMPLLCSQLNKIRCIYIIYIYIISRQTNERIYTKIIQQAQLSVIFPREFLIAATIASTHSIY